ncbi:MAG TPA: metal ABC transporter permease, partial [Gemmatimonadales bacterium]|nr:metal ABC transporter permease [Gemmatimonadales bacterium]
MMPDDLAMVWQVMRWPLAACLILPPLLVYLGLHVVEREVIFVDLALAQVATLGTCVGLIMGYDFNDRITFWISLGVTFLGAALFSWSRSSRKRPVPQEAIIGITYAVAAAAAIVFVDKAPHGAEHIKYILVGNLLWVTPGHVAV